MKHLLQLILIIFLLSIMSGCGAYRTVNAKPEFLRSSSEYNQVKKALQSVEFSEPTIEGRFLSLKIIENYSVPEYSYDIIEEKSRSVQEPSLIGIINLFNPLSWLVAIGTGDLGSIYSKHKPPFGKRGKWRRTEKKENYQKTGKTKILSKKPLQYYSVAAFVSGNNKETGDFLYKNLQTGSTNGLVKIDIKKIAEQFKERPKTLQVNVSASGKKGKFSKKITWSLSQLESLNLQSSVWVKNERERALPVEVRQDMYSKQLLNSLQAEKYYDAVKYCNKLKKLGIELPDSLEFFYGKSLYKTGQYKKAYPVLEGYTKKAGRNGRYYLKALELISELNK